MKPNTNLIIGRAIDLNCDLGEGCGDDTAMLGLVSTANLACGGHAGDESTLTEVVKTSKKQQVRIGAHPSYPDRENFGRHQMTISADDLQQSLTDQIALAVRVAEAQSHPLTHVKAHGALYNFLEENQELAQVVAAAIKAVNPALTWLGLPGRAAEAVANSQGIEFKREFFADRAYLPNGTLAPRSTPGAVLHDPAKIAQRVLEAVNSSTISDIYGNPLAVKFDSICVHGDTEVAVEMARKIRQTLENNGVSIRAFA
ncbi:MAG: LamB/YcsF family protein [Alphaproteobacteria bacterium]